MKGRFHKRGSTWTVIYDEPSGEDGRRRQRSKGGFATRKDAERFLTEQLDRMQRGTYATPSKLTVADFLDHEWLPAVEPTLRPLSATRYRSVVRPYLTPGIGSLRLQGLSAGHLNGLYAQLEQDGLSGGRVASCTRSSAGRCATPSGGAGSRGTWRGWRTRRRGRAPGRPPGARANSAGSSTHVEGDRLLAGWRLAATTGMRRGDYRACRGAHSTSAGRGSRSSAARADARRCDVRSAEVGSVAADGGAGPRTVDALREHRETQQLERHFAGAAHMRIAISCSRRAGRVDPPSAAHGGLSREHRRAAGIPTGTLHTLRHTAATLALTRGVPVHIVAARLGDDPKTDPRRPTRTCCRSPTSWPRSGSPWQLVD